MRSLSECEWKQGEPARGKSKPFLRREQKGERVAPPVGPRRPDVDRSRKKGVDTTGLLMEAVTVRERFPDVEMAGTRLLGDV